MPARKDAGNSRQNQRTWLRASRFPRWGKILGQVIAAGGINSRECRQASDEVYARNRATSGRGRPSARSAVIRANKTRSQTGTPVFPSSDGSFGPALELP